MKRLTAAVTGVGLPLAVGAARGVVCGQQYRRDLVPGRRGNPIGDDTLVDLPSRNGQL